MQDDHQQQDFETPLPYKPEAEAAALGAVLIKSDTAFDHVAELPLSAWTTKHQPIVKAILAVREAGEPVDLVTVTEQLMADGKIDKIGGVQYLADLANSVPNTSNVDHYVQMIREAHARRELHKLYQQQAAAALEAEDVQEVINSTDTKQRGVQVVKNNAPLTPIKDVLLNAFETVEQRFHTSSTGQTGVTGTPSGYADLDKMTSGFRKQDLIILAARPAVGKTAFALNVAQNVAVRSRETVAVFSLEMSKEQLVERMMCAEGNVDAQRLRSGQLDEDDWPKLTMVVGTLSEAPIFIDDTPGITVAEIRSKCARLKKEHGLSVILIDYLQLIAGGNGANRQERVAEISRTLKLIARELDCTVIALSQLSRSVEQRQDKRPMLSDLRESGSIEQDADIVAFLYRHDYYEPDTDKKNIVEVIIAKQRSGPTGTVELVFLKNFNKFVNLERAPGVA